MATPLKSTLSLTELTFYGVGTIVGAGIYSVLGAAAGETGAGVWVSLLLAGIAAFITGLSYAELISLFPRAGAEYHFLTAAFPRWPLLPFLAGYLIALNSAATSATVALAFGGYFRVFLDLPLQFTAFLLLVACTLVNIAGIRQSTWVGIALICIEVGGLLLLTAAGFADGGVMATVRLPSFGELGGLFAGTALVFFIYIGFEDVANLAEEARTPGRDVAWALLLSIVITSIIYLLVTWVVLARVPPALLARSDSPLTLAGNTLSPWLGDVLAISALFSTASTALISLISISRMLFGMAREGALPAVLATVGAHRQTPWVAALALFAAACALLPLGDVKVVASLASLGVLTVFVGVQLALIRLRFTHPELPRRFRVPGTVGRLPLLPLLGSVIALALITQFEAEVYEVALLALLLGLLLRWLTRGPARPRRQ